MNEIERLATGGAVVAGGDVVNVGVGPGGGTVDPGGGNVDPGGGGNVVVNVGVGAGGNVVVGGGLVGAGVSNMQSGENSSVGIS